jgi:hypothetical protein
MDRKKAAYDKSTVRASYYFDLKDTQIRQFLRAKSEPRGILAQQGTPKRAALCISVLTYAASLLKLSLSHRPSAKRMPAFAVSRIPPSLSHPPNAASQVYRPNAYRCALLLILSSSYSKKKPSLSEVSSHVSLYRDLIISTAAVFARRSTNMLCSIGICQY